MKEKQNTTLPITLSSAKNGDEQALAAIISRFIPSIRWFSSRAAIPGLDYEDAVQEGLIGLFHAIQTYNPDNGATFTTYANNCIKNAIFSARRAAKRKKHAPLNYSVPYPETAASVGLEDAVVAREQISDVMLKARTVLSRMEKKVLHFLLHGYSNTEISKKLNVSQKSVENAVSRMRRKLK